MLVLSEHESSVNRRHLFLQESSQSEIIDSNSNTENRKDEAFRNEKEIPSTFLRSKSNLSINTILRESLRNIGSTKSSKDLESQRKIYQRHLCDVKCSANNSRFLDDDVFSILLVCDNKSHVMIFSIVTIAFQYAIILQLINGALPRDGDNFFGVPNDIDIEVRISQAFAIFLMAASQEDFYDATAFLFDGYSPEIVTIAPHATRIKYYISAILKLMEGALCIFTTFILVVQSNAVVGLFLNFAALGFLTDIDNFIYHMAKYYIITDELGILANKVMYLEIPIPRRHPGINDEVSSYRIINYFYVTVFCITCWCVCTLHQYEGRYSCQSLQVQFGDDSMPALGIYSGAYDRVKLLGLPKFRVNQRSVYKRRYSEDAMFLYCNSEQAWVFTVNLNGGSYLEIEDPCTIYAAKSQETESFDLIETSRNKWYTWNLATGNTADSDFFHLQCIDCNNCNGVGSCTDNVCVCDPGTYGLNCEFKSSILCNELVESVKLNPFVQGENASYRIVEADSHISSHERPVYYREINDGKTLEIILFNGRRWAFTRTNFTADIDKVNLFKTVVKSYDVMSSEYAPTYLSESVNVGSALDRGSPIRLSWFKTTIYGQLYKVDTSISVKSQLLCPICNNSTNTCLNGGTCAMATDSSSTAYCICLMTFHGKLCEATRDDSAKKSHF